MSLLAQSVTAFALSAMLIVLLRPLALRYGWVDEPDARKRHAAAVPLVGGMAFTLAFAAVTWLWDSPAPGAAYFLAAGLLLVVGAIDDRHALKPWHRFLAQAVAAALMIFVAGLSIDSVGDLVGSGRLELGWFAVPFTLFCVSGLVNAFNMADGVDGLAGSLTIVACAVFAYAASASGMEAGAAALIVLACAVAGFLLFNLPTPIRPFTAFMGDSGSMVIGFMMVWMAIATTQRPEATLYPICAVWMLGLPILDTVATLIRRMRHGGSPFAPGRDHLHHLLQAFGFSDGQVVLTMSAAMLLLGAAALGAWRAGVPEWVLTGAFLALAAGYYALGSLAWERVRRTRG